MYLFQRFLEQLPPVQEGIRSILPSREIRRHSCWCLPEGKPRDPSYFLNCQKLLYYSSLQYNIFLSLFLRNNANIKVLRGSDLIDDVIAQFEHRELKREQEDRELQKQKEEEEKVARDLLEKQENEAKLNQSLTKALEKLQKKKDQQVFEDRLKRALEQRKMEERKRQEEQMRRLQEEEEERQWQEQQMLAYKGKFFMIHRIRLLLRFHKIELAN